jgi:NAD(P)H-dependent FMN reductase
MKLIQVIVGSMRPTRIGDQVTDWLLEVIGPKEGLNFEIVDLSDWPLPLADEPGLPSDGDYIHEHTKAWSRKIAAADGYVFVTPQYNWGYPAALKNALDHLYNEWNGKPAAIVSYAHRGGGKAAGQLRQVLEGLHMRSAATMPAIAFKDDMLNKGGRLARPAEDFAPYTEMVNQSVDELISLLAE